MTLEIRNGRAADAVAIAAFNCAMAQETEGLKLDSPRVLAGVRAVLEDPGKGLYLVAENDGDIIGQLLITREWSDWRNGVFWWIQSVYVPPEHRSRGVFKALYHEALSRAQEAGDVCGVRLYVEGDNTDAQRTYAKLGMQETAYKLFETDFVLRR